MKNSVVPLGFAIFGLLATATESARAQTSAETLYQRLSSGVACWQAGESRHCTYKISDILSIAIARVGEPEALISFPLSNCDKEVCAGMYVDCAVVMVTSAFAAKDAVPPIVYISPRNGFVYKSFDECHRAK